MGQSLPCISLVVWPAANNPRLPGARAERRREEEHDPWEMVVRSPAGEASGQQSTRPDAHAGLHAGGQPHLRPVHSLLRDPGLTHRKEVLARFSSLFMR